MIQKACSKSESFTCVLPLNSIVSFKPPCSGQNGRKSAQSPCSQLITAGLRPFSAFLCYVLCRTSI